MNAREEISLLLEADVEQCGDDLDELRRLEADLEPMKSHPLVAAAVREISSKILCLSLEEE